MDSAITIWEIILIITLSLKTLVIVQMMSSANFLRHIVPHFMVVIYGVITTLKSAEGLRLPITEYFVFYSS